MKENIDYPWEIYTLKELLQATNNFNKDNKIGEGGFGSVYWGRTNKGVEVIITIIFLILKIKFIVTHHLVYIISRVEFS